MSPLLAAATHIPAVASPTDAPKIKPACRSVNYVAVPWCWNAISQDDDALAAQDASTQSLIKFYRANREF